MLVVGLGCVARSPAGVGRPEAEGRLWGQPATALPADAIDLVVFNAAKGRGRHFEDAMAELLHDAELALLQEVVVPDMDAALDDAELSWVVARSFSFTARRGEPATGVATGSTARAQAVRSSITANTEPFARTPKAALLSTYALEGTSQRLLVVNVHCINFRRAAFLAAQLDALAPAVAGHSGPVIVAGDFNTHHRRRVEVVERFIEALGLRPAFADEADDDRTRVLGRPLDHVFVRGLVVERAEVVHVLGASDHRPLRVQLRLPDDGAPFAGRRGAATHKPPGVDLLAGLGR